MMRSWESAPIGHAAEISAKIRQTLPILTTQRLRLRAPLIADFDAWAAIECGERGVHIGGPFSREEAWLDFSQAIAGWVLKGTGLWSVERLADGELVGFVLLHHEFGDPEVELGFLFTQAGEGQGYATEAALAALNHAFATLNWPTLVSYVDPANARSIRLNERLGATLDPSVQVEDADPCLVYRHPNPRGAR